MKPFITCQKYLNAKKSETQLSSRGFHGIDLLQSNLEKSVISCDFSVSNTLTSMTSMSISQYLIVSHGVLLSWTERRGRTRTGCFEVIMSLKGSKIPFNANRLKQPGRQMV